MLQSTVVRLEVSISMPTCQTPANVHLSIRTKLLSDSNLQDLQVIYRLHVCVSLCCSKLQGDKPKCCNDRKVCQSVVLGKACQMIKSGVCDCAFLLATYHFETLILSESTLSGGPGQPTYISNESPALEQITSWLQRE